MENRKPENYPFDLRIEELDGEKYYVCRFRDFPTVVGAGETTDEAIAEGREALAGMLEYYLETGKKIPEPSVTESIEASGRLTVRMPKGLHLKLIQRSEEEGASLNTLVVQALSEYLERQEKAGPIIETLAKWKNLAAKSSLQEVVNKYLTQDWYGDYPNSLKNDTSYWSKRGVDTYAN